MPRTTRFGRPPPGSSLSGKQARKQRRKEERSAAKVRSVPLAKAFEGHDTTHRQRKKRALLSVQSLQRAVEKETKRVKEYDEDAIRETLLPKKKYERGIKGAARPAWVVYPELYPEMYVEKPRDVRDLVKENEGKCFGNIETRKLMGLLVELGHASLASGKDARKPFKDAMELDVEDPFDANLGYVVACLDRKQVAEDFSFAKDRMDEAEVLYTGALMDHLKAKAVAKKATKQGEEEEPLPRNELLDRAIKAFPHIALALAEHETVSQVVDCDIILERIREKRTARLDRAVYAAQPDRLAGRCDAGVCTMPESFAIAFFAAYSDMWKDADACEVVAQYIDGLEGEEFVDDEMEEEEGEDEKQEEEVEEQDEEDEDREEEEEDDEEEGGDAEEHAELGEDGEEDAVSSSAGQVKKNSLDEKLRLMYEEALA